MVSAHRMLSATVTSSKSGAIGILAVTRRSTSSRSAVGSVPNATWGGAQHWKR